MGNMAKARRAETIGNTAFPLYTIRMIGDHHFLVAGGGGQAKTGIPNAMEIFTLKRDENMCIAQKVFTFDTGEEPIMNSTAVPDGKNYMLAAGQGDSCYLYRLNYKVVVPRKEGQVLEGVRKRKGNLTDSEEHKSAKKEVTFEVSSSKHLKTDFHKDGGFQKAVQITKDLSVIVTGGADGKLRLWKYVDLKKLYEIKAHKNEIDDLDISPSGDKVVTVSRDNHAYVWNTKDGSKFLELQWERKTEAQYRYRGCRYAKVVDKDESRLFTMHIPSARGKNPLPCYLTKWETTAYRPMRSTTTGTEILSSIAVSDDGTYLGVGTISGSVSIYIAFSLQRLYHVKEAHGIFVTGLSFTPSSPACRLMTGDMDCSLLSISADNQIKMHQVAPRTMYSVLWVVAGFVIIIYFLFWFISTVGI